MASRRPQSLSSPALTAGRLQIDAFDDCAFDGTSQPLALSTKAESAAESNSAAAGKSIWVSLVNGEQLHMRHLVPADAGADAQSFSDDENVQFESQLNQSLQGRSAFLLHGEVECGRIYSDGAERGLAHYLLARGCEVFIADLGGRGGSLVPSPLKNSELDIHTLVTEAIPAMLDAAAVHSVLRAGAGPDVWVGHGFGAVLLAATWARLDAARRTAKQWVFFAGRRRFGAARRSTALFTRLFCHPLIQRWVSWRKVLPATRLGLGSADENAAWYRCYANWISTSQWRCDDGFDYLAALKRAPAPPTLHLAASDDPLFCNIQDVREFMHELGQHDARLMLVDTVRGSGRAYSHLGMLLEPDAEIDVFAPLVEWLSAAQNHEHKANNGAQREKINDLHHAGHRAGDSPGVHSHPAKTAVQVESYYAAQAAMLESRRDTPAKADSRKELRKHRGGTTAEKLANIL
ncbi:MAG: alpha/beta fold hydrolase [Gammaproteobacteria bacterium]|nr:alpha/beta fold hydrolase [Gammaproteobacteria bacterium]